MPRNPHRAKRRCNAQENLHNSDKKYKLWFLKQEMTCDLRFSNVSVSFMMFQCNISTKQLSNALALCVVQHRRKTACSLKYQYYFQFPFNQRSLSQFLQAGLENLRTARTSLIQMECDSCHPANSVKVLKVHCAFEVSYKNVLYKSTVIIRKTTQQLSTVLGVPKSETQDSRTVSHLPLPNHKQVTVKNVPIKSACITSLVTIM